MEKFFKATIVLFVLLAMSTGRTQAADNGNGTVTVNGLVWLKDAGCLGKTTWANGIDYAGSLGAGSCNLNDGSKPGDWRLPNTTELVNVSGSKGKFDNIATMYWSAVTYNNGKNSDYAEIVYIGYGMISHYNKLNAISVWAVRKAP